MAAEDIEIRIKAAIDTAESATKISDIKKSMKELKSLGLEVGDTNTEAFRKINKAAGELDDKVGDLNQSFKAMSGEPIENLSRSFKGLRDNLASGDFKTAKVMFNNMKTSIADLGKSFLGIQEGASGASIAIKSFGAALAATGIVVVIASIVLLIKYWDDLKESTGALGDMVRNLTKKFEEIKKVVVDFAKEAIQKLVDGFVELYNKSMLLRGVIEAVKLTFKTFVDVVVLGAKLIIDYFKTIGNAFNDLIHLKNPMQSIKDGIAEAGEDFKAFGDNFKNNFVKAIDNTKNATLKPVGDLFGQIKKKGDKSLKDTKDRLSKEKEEYLKQQRELAAQLMANANSLETWRVQQQKDSLGKRLQLFDLQSEKEEQQLRKYGATEAEITEWRNQQVFDITKKWNEEQNKLKTEEALADKALADKAIQDARDKSALLLSIQTDSVEVAKEQWDIDNADKIQKLQEAGLSEAEIHNWIASEKNRIDQEYANKAKQLEDEVYAHRLQKAQQGLQIAQSVAGAINAIGELMATLSSNRDKKSVAERNKAAKKAFIMNKVLGITNAGISTAMAVIAGLQAGLSMGPAGIVMGPLMAALAGATGVVSIAAIAAKKFDPEQESASGGTSVPSAPSISAATSIPNAPQMPESASFFGLGQNNLINNANTPDTRVYVVESDITNTQNRVAKVKDRSELGG